MSAPIRVAVVDDHPMVLRGTCQMIEEAPDLVVVARGQDAEQALALVEEAAPDVLLLDVNLPGRDGVAVVRALRARGKRLGIVMLSFADDEYTILRALQAGANGYLLKSADEQAIQRALRLAARGQTAVLQPDVSRVAASGKRVEEEYAEPLSEREIEVVRELARDMSNKQIAARLGISDRTVQQHLSKIFLKLAVASRTGAVLKALRLGTITLEETRE